MKKFNRTLITSALPYANGPLHIGHLAGAYLNADIYARYLRAKGEEIIYVCGSDEHGAAISIRAQKEGKSPKEIVDYYHELNKNSFAGFGISFDIYHRTSDDLHYETAQDFFSELNDHGKFEVIKTDQFYDPKAKQFLADRFIMGTCPNCQNENAYGDQCEKCGTSLSPNELINPRSTLSDSPLELKETTHWYFPLNKYEDWLKEWILTDHANDWKKNVLGQCRSWLSMGLHPRAMTRDLDWGVPVPLSDAKGKVLYVWLDAPIGYISATKAWGAREGKEWENYWKQEDTRLIHFIGKDNIVFHTIIFPSLLKAHGHFILPDQVPANEFMNLEGDKISTSRDWAVWLNDYLDEVPNRQDEMRYVLTANMPETKDSEFTWADYQSRINNELVGNLGNFVNRVLVLSAKYFEGKVQELDNDILTETDKKTLEEIRNFRGKIDSHLEAFRFRDSLATLMEISKLGNQYLAEREPWKLIKTEPKQVANCLNISAQIMANVAAAMQIFLPFKTKNLLAMLQLESISWDSIGSLPLSAGHQLGKAELLFEKVDDELIEKQQEKLMRSKEEHKDVKIVSTPILPEINFEDVMKVDIRVGKITSAKKVENTDKLLVFEVDMGFEKRTIISGVATHYAPEVCVGKQVCVVANLAPKKMRGIESQGMILFAEDSEGNLRFISPEVEIENGSKIS